MKKNSHDALAHNHSSRASDPHLMLASRYDSFAGCTTCRRVDSSVYPMSFTLTLFSSARLRRSDPQGDWFVQIIGEITETDPSDPPSSGPSSSLHRCATVSELSSAGKKWKRVKSEKFRERAISWGLRGKPSRSVSGLLRALPHTSRSVAMRWIWGKGYLR